MQDIWLILLIGGGATVLLLLFVLILYCLVRADFCCCKTPKKGARSHCRRSRQDSDQDYETSPRNVRPIVHHDSQHRHQKWHRDQVDKPHRLNRVPTQVLIDKCDRDRRHRHKQSTEKRRRRPKPKVMPKTHVVDYQMVTARQSCLSPEPAPKYYALPPVDQNQLSRYEMTQRTDRSFYSTLPDSFTQMSDISAGSDADLSKTLSPESMTYNNEQQEVEIEISNTKPHVSSSAITMRSYDQPIADEQSITQSPSQIEYSTSKEFLL